MTDVLLDVKTEEEKTPSIKSLKRTDTLLKKVNTPENIIRNMLKNNSTKSQTPSTKSSTPSPASNRGENINVINGMEFLDASDPNLWTEEIVQQFMDFAEACKISAEKCKKASIKHSLSSDVIHIIIIVFGSIIAMASIGNINNEIKYSITSVCGSLTTLLMSIESYLKYPQKSKIEESSCLELEKLSRGIRIELSKPKEYRPDPCKYLIRLENQREKIIKKTGIKDD